jgi:hypothetical protein
MPAVPAWSVKRGCSSRTALASTAGRGCNVSGPRMGPALWDSISGRRLDSIVGDTHDSARARKASSAAISTRRRRGSGAPEMARMGKGIAELAGGTKCNLDREALLCATESGAGRRGNGRHECRENPEAQSGLN